MRPTELLDPALAAQATATRQRARSLREQALGLPEVLATTYRRRAAELELAAWALDARAGVRADEADLHVPTAA